MFKRPHIAGYFVESELRLKVTASKTAAFASKAANSLVVHLWIFSRDNVTNFCEEESVKKYNGIRSCIVRSAKCNYI